MTTTNTSATPEALKAKQDALARVNEEMAKLSPTIPMLQRKVAEARETLDQAKLAGIVAKGTPGFEDDAAAERSAKKAQALLDAACLALDNAEDRITFLGRAEKQLASDVDRMKAALHTAHLERSKAELLGKIEAQRAGFAEFLRLVAALRTLQGSTTWPQELHSVLEQSVPGLALQVVIREGQDRTDRIRAGATVAEVLS